MKVWLVGERRSKGVSKFKRLWFGRPNWKKSEGDGLLCLPNGTTEGKPPDDKKVFLTGDW